MENVNNSIYASANQFFSLHAYSISAIASPTRCGHIGELRRNRSEYYPDIELLPNVVTTRRCVPPLHLFPLRFVCAFNRARCNDDDDVVGRRAGTDGRRKRSKTALPRSRRCVSVDTRWWCRNEGRGRETDGGPGGPSVRISIIDSAECSCRIRARLFGASVCACVRVFQCHVRVFRSSKSVASARARAHLPIRECVCVGTRARFATRASGRPFKVDEGATVGARGATGSLRCHSAIGARDVRTCRARETCDRARPPPVILGRTSASGAESADRQSSASSSVASHT